MTATTLRGVGSEYRFELAELTGKEIHEPWARKQGLPDGYPGPIVDHAQERNSSLAAYQHLRER